MIFSELQKHSDVAATLHGNVVSAGFIDITTLKCFGESDSLGVPSRPEDTAVVKSLF